MVLVLQPAVGRSPADYATVNVPRDLVLSHTGLHRKMQALQIGSAPASRHASKALRAFTYWRCADGGGRPRAMHFALRWRALGSPAPGYAALSPSRARLSVFPSTTRTSKMPGEVARPVSAARSGWATAPSLTPSASAKARTAASVASAYQGSTAASLAASFPIRARASPVSKEAVLSSSASGRVA